MAYTSSATGTRGQLLSGRRRLLTAAFSALFPLWMVPSLQDLAGSSTPLSTKVAQLTVTLAYLLCYPIGIYLSAGLRQWPKTAFAAGTVVLGFAVVWLVGPDGVTVLVYAMALCAVMLPRKIAFPTALGLTVITFVVSFFGSTGPDWGTLALMAALSLGLVGYVKVGGDLAAANQQVARLAVAEERARVARDIHDVLGHSLTTVTVKLGLIRRLLETRPDEVDRIIVEVGDAEQLSRQALSEVRATLSGYRSASLSAEVAGARAALASAGISADLPSAVDNVVPAYQESFAYVLREGVTNVLRHSGATSCEVRLGESWLEVRDNGTVDAASAGANRGDAGSGLAGLADRLAEIGGKVDAGPVPGGGFLLRASVPQQVSA
jgi:two-component system, NarL family, sensor histidine kinase DesK